MPMAKTTLRVPLWAVAMSIVSTYSAVLARAQLTDTPARTNILNGLAPDRKGRVGGASVDGRGTEIAPSEVDVTKGPRESQVAGPAAAALAPAPAGVIDADELASEVAKRFEGLEGCRMDVARRRRSRFATSRQIDSRCDGPSPGQDRSPPLRWSGRRRSMPLPSRPLEDGRTKCWGIRARSSSTRTWSAMRAPRRFESWSRRGVFMVI